MLKDFDVTQIGADTKIVVFRVPFSDYIHNIHDTHGAMMALESHLTKISDTLKEVGVKAVFIDDSIQVEILTDELLKSNQLKVAE